MTDKAAQDEDAIRRAYANLKSLRDNIPPGYVTDAVFYETFNRSLDLLQQTGADVREWRLPRKPIGEMDQSEFFLQIDAILAYFTILEQKIPIGFRM
jgi:hypothetical protein